MKFLKKENQIICNWNNWEFCFRKNSLLSFERKRDFSHSILVILYNLIPLSHVISNSRLIMQVKISFGQFYIYLDSSTSVARKQRKTRVEPSHRLGINISWSTSESLALNIYDKISKYLQCSAKRTLVSLTRLCIHTIYFIIDILSNPSRNEKK